MKQLSIAALLSFNGRFVDTAGFLGLQGLFTAHVTGNFVTLAATLVMGTHGVIAKLVALPEFVLIVALSRIAGLALRAHGMPALQILLAAKVGFALAFFIVAVALGPFPDSDSPAALLTAFAGVAGMAVQNAVQRLHLANVPTGGSRPLCAYTTRNNLVCGRMRRRCYPLLLGRLLVPCGASRGRRGDRHSQAGELKVRFWSFEPFHSTWMSASLIIGPRGSMLSRAFGMCGKAVCIHSRRFDERRVGC